MRYLKNIFLQTFIALCLSNNAYAGYCASVTDAGAHLTSQGGVTIENNTFVVRGGAGAGASTGNVKTCGDSWGGTPKCKRGYGPSPKTTDSSCDLARSEECKKPSGVSNKEACALATQMCEESSDECLDSSPIEGTPTIVSLYERSNGAPHGGIDYSASYGTAALAPISGVYKLNGGGSITVYNAENDITAVFHHLFCVPEELASGDYVKKDEIVGWVGNTGQSAGPHMHIGFYEGTSKPASRTGYLNPMDTTNNTSFCEIEDVCTIPGQTSGKASGVEGLELRVCGTDDYVAGNAPGAGAAPTPNGSSSPDGKKVKDNSKCHPTTFIKWFDGCLFCHLFKTVFNAASKIAKTSYDAFANPVTEVLFVATAIWLAFKILPFMASFKGGDISEMLTDILKQLLLIFVIIVFLKSEGMGFFNYIMEPIFNTGFSIAKALLDTGTECSKSDYGILTGADAGLPASMGNNIVCTIEQVQRSISGVLAIGMTSLCVSCFVEYSLVPFILPDVSYLLTGLLILLGGTYLLIVFPFLVLDSVLQLTVAAGLLPFAMGAFPFKATKEYSMKVWQTFMTVVFNFVFLCLIMMICAKTIEGMVNDTIVITLKNALSGNNWDTLKEAMGWETVLVFKILFMFILSYTMLQEVKNFTDQFSGGGGMSLGMASNAGTLMSSGALNVGKKLTGGMARATAKGVKKTAGRAVRGSINGIHNLRTQIKGNSARKNANNAFKGKSMADTAPSTTSTDLKNMQADLAGLEAKKEIMAKNGASQENMNNINKMIESKKQDISTEQKALSSGAKQEVSVGDITYIRYSDGRVDVKEKKGDEIITNEYGFDAQGRSTRNKEKEDTKKARVLRRAIEKSGGQGVLNNDGSTTYTYMDKIGRQMSVTEGLDGSIERSYINAKGEVVAEEITKDTKKVTSYTHSGRDTKIYDNSGRTVYNSDNYKSGLNKIIKGDGTLNQNEVYKIKADQRYLEQQIAQEKDAIKLKGLEALLKKEKQKTDKIIGEAILAKTFSEKYYKKDEQCLKREVVSEYNAITIKEYRADGSIKTYNIKVNKDKPPMVEMITQDPEGNKTTFKTDGILQVKTFEDKDGNKKEHFAINSDLLNGVYDKYTAERRIEKILSSSKFPSELKTQAIDYIKNYIESGGKNKPMKAFN